MIDLTKYVGKTVMLQLKQPYQVQMARIERGIPVPIAFEVQEGAPLQLATDRSDPTKVQKLAVDVLVAKIVARDSIVAAQVDDPTGGGKVEIEITADMLMAVTAVCEDRIIRP